MSVRKGDREKDDLELINHSRELVEYTYDRCHDRNIFPKSERWLLVKNIWDMAIGARTNIIQANSIRVESPEEAQERLAKEKMAIGQLETLITLIDLCDIKDMITSERAEYWAGLATKVLYPLKHLLKTDRQRYGEYRYK